MGSHVISTPEPMRKRPWNPYCQCSDQKSRKSFQNHPKNHPKTHPKRHTKNEERFHSTFERFPAQNRTKKAPESKAKTMPKTDAKNEGRGKPTP